MSMTTTGLDNIVALDELSSSHVEQLHQLYQGEFWSRARTLEQTRRIVAGSSLNVGLADSSNGALAAYARVLTDGVVKAFIFDMIVDPRYRGRGLGTRVINRILGHFLLSQVEHVELYCLPELAPFYARWGFSSDVGAIGLMRRSAARYVHPLNAVAGPYG
jgi:GNAT superfamily N-acetyltransferase